MFAKVKFHRALHLVDVYSFTPGVCCKHQPGVFVEDQFYEHFSVVVVCLFASGKSVPMEPLQSNSYTILTKTTMF